MAFDPDPAAAAAENLLLDDALRQTARDRWQGNRTAHGNIGQAEIAIADLKARYGKALRVSDVTTAMLKVMVREWQHPTDGRKEGLAPASITRRLYVLSAMGINVKGTRPKLGRKLKWFLTQDAQEMLTAELRKIAAAPPPVDEIPAPPPPCESDERNPPTVTETGLVFREGRFAFPLTVWSHIPPRILWAASTFAASEARAVRKAKAAKMMADYVDFICFTGLRVEEALRLTVKSFGVNPRTGLMSIAIPGTKTASAAATLPLGAEVQAFAEGLIADAKQREESGEDKSGAIFPVSYREMSDLWVSLCRPILGVGPEATLKALRRSAARYLHAIKGMPLDLLRQCLRHSDVQTTMGYLRLVGGYGEDELRRFLD
jgi:hypothetical protein